MPFKSILVVVTNPAKAAASIAAGAEIALAHNGHLDVLALGVDHLQLGYSYLGGGAVLTEMALDRAEADARAAETAAKSALAAQDPTLRWALETATAEMGGVVTILRQMASFADLVVQCRPYGDGQGPEAEAVVEAVLFDARSPVLILPGALPKGQLTLPRRIMLAWNQSAEALTAIKAAMPLLQAADLVDITVIDPPGHGPERSDPGGMLCQFRPRHGVKAAVTVLARSDTPVAQVLARHAMDWGADLMIMGAYGHSRLREAVLGGATRAVLEHASIPVLMAH